MSASHAWMSLILLPLVVSGPAHARNALPYPAVTRGPATASASAAAVQAGQAAALAKQPGLASAAQTSPARANVPATQASAMPAAATLSAALRPASTLAPRPSAPLARASLSGPSPEARRDLPAAIQGGSASGGNMPSHVLGGMDRPSVQAALAAPARGPVTTAEASTTAQGPQRVTAALPESSRPRGPTTLARSIPGTPSLVRPPSNKGSGKR